MEEETKLHQYIEEFKKMAAGVHITNPSEKIPIENYSISRRALKHFIESRTEQSADIDNAIKNLKDTVQKPEINIINLNQSYLNSRLLGREIQNDTKALMIVVDSNNEIVSIHYKKIKQFAKIKDQILAGGEAASGA